MLAAKLAPFPSMMLDRKGEMFDNLSDRGSDFTGECLSLPRQIKQKGKWT